MSGNVDIFLTEKSRHKDKIRLGEWQEFLQPVGLQRAIQFVGFPYHSWGFGNQRWRCRRYSMKKRIPTTTDLVSAHHIPIAADLVSASHLQIVAPYYVLIKSTWGDEDVFWLWNSVTTDRTVFAGYMRVAKSTNITIKFLDFPQLRQSAFTWTEICRYMYLFNEPALLDHKSLVYKLFAFQKKKVSLCLLNLIKFNFLKNVKSTPFCIWWFSWCNSGFRRFFVRVLILIG